jgi:membrane fusion protein, multidrug efflux system
MNLRDPLSPTDEAAPAEPIAPVHKRAPSAPPAATPAAATAAAAPAPAAAATAPAAPALSPARRSKALLLLGVLLLLAGAAYGWYWNGYLRHFESTDNAYVQAPVVQLTSQVGGTVLAVRVDDTDAVKAGQPLVVLDPADAKLALQRAQAQLAQTVREVRTMYLNNGSFNAQIEVRRAEVARMRADVDRAADDVKRRAPLVAGGAVSGEEMMHSEATAASARSALAAAQSALAAAEQQAASNQALTEGTRIEEHPSVQRAAAALREAWLALQRSELKAPVAGQVARRTVQAGQRIAAGTPLLSIIALDQAWVEANFKEVQLRDMRIGQPVKLMADLYGSKVEFDGRVAGLGAGTGSAFALLPAQNATGNWIKVVQRLPVRIELDARQLAEHPLRVGLSMQATVDLSDRAGPTLQPVPTTSNTADQRSVDDQTAGAERMVREIIQANLGKGAAR